MEIREFYVMHKFCLITLILVLACGCQNIGSRGGTLVASEDRVINPEIVKRIEEKRAQDSGGPFPNLSEIPTELPERYETATISRFQSQLFELGATLVTNVAGDKSDSTEVRQVMVSILVDGERKIISLEEAASLVAEYVEQDQQSARELRSKPVPALGGLPPKEQRE